MAILPGFGIVVPDAPKTKWTMSGPIATGTYNPDWNKAATPATPAPADTGPSAEDIYWGQRAEYEAQQRRAQEDAVISTVQGMFAQYGLTSLYDKVVEYARKGYNGDAIAVMLRSTPEYKARFPAMEALAKKGRAISEAAYVDYERTAAQIEQRYGLAQGMVTGNVTKLLTEEVSAAELNDRVVLASADSLNAPEDLKNTLRDYWNIDPQTALSSYYLDPDVAMPLLEKQSATARIGVWINRQGVAGLGRDMASELQAQGVTEQQAEQGFGAVKAQEGFTAGKGETIDTANLARGAFGNADQAQRAERIGQTRANKFAGGGGFADSNKGVGGLGSSSG
jgi:hypothetical protein